jgi:hypothetical protein
MKLSVAAAVGRCTLRQGAHSLLHMGVVCNHSFEPTSHFLLCTLYT